MSDTVSFKVRFPEFSLVDDTRVQLFLDDAARLMKAPNKWLDFYDVAHEYHAAHFLACSEHTDTGDSGIMAPAKKQEVDDVIIENAVQDIAPTFDNLYSTAYGRQYISYRRIITVGIYGV